MIVTRFAPSPTGFLHLGHAYAALTAWHAANRGGGRFLLRIEDIDTGRCRPEFEQAVFKDLAWLGIGWEAPVRRQSEHFRDYTLAVTQLNARGLVYPCFCSRKEIAAEIARAANAPDAVELAEPLYPGTCRNITPAEREARISSGAGFALRLDCRHALAEVDRNRLTFVERGRGPDGETGVQPARPEQLGDIVLTRKDLPASYHLAVVVDDALQGVTRVTRGQDLFSATHIQRLLQELLGLPVPEYGHHRLILGPDGKKFSKRNSSVTLRALRAAGTTPQDVRNLIGM